MNNSNPEETKKRIEEIKSLRDGQVDFMRDIMPFVGGLHYFGRMIGELLKDKTYRRRHELIEAILDKILIPLDKAESSGFSSNDGVKPMLLKEPAVSELYKKIKGEKDSND